MIILLENTESTVSIKSHGTLFLKAKQIQTNVVHMALWTIHCVQLLNLVLYQEGSYRWLSILVYICMYSDALCV